MSHVPIPKSGTLAWESLCSWGEGEPAVMYDGVTGLFACEKHIPLVLKAREKALNPAKTQQS